MLLTAGGWPVSQDTCYPFGAEPYPPGDANHYKFSGKERDAESGNDYFGARYYSSSMGRFLTPDWSAAPQAMPYADLGNPQSFNRYVYANNNPLGGIDPDGHSSDSSNGQPCGEYGSFLNTNTGTLTAAQVPCSAPPPLPAAGDPTEVIVGKQVQPPVSWLANSNAVKSIEQEKEDQLDHRHHLPIDHTPMRPPQSGFVQVGVQVLGQSILFFNFSNPLLNPH